MIRINLLPVRQTQRRQTIQQQLLAGAAVLILAIIGSIVWTAAISSKKEALITDITQKKNELAQLDKIIGEVNEFEKKKKELEQKLATIEDLRKRKSGPVRALDDLANEIPNRVWILKLEEKNGSVTIDGSAIDHEDVSAFMKALQKSKYFSNITLGHSKADKPTASGVTLYNFRITCTVTYSA